MTPRREQRAQQVYQLRSQGWTYPAIGQHLGISTQQARLDDQAYEQTHGDPFYVEWDHEGRHCYDVGRARNADAARRRLGPFMYLTATVRAITEAELEVLQAQVRAEWRDDRRWDTDDRVAFAEQMVARARAR